MLTASVHPDEDSRVSTLDVEACDRSGSAARNGRLVVPLHLRPRLTVFGKGGEGNEGTVRGGGEVADGRRGGDDVCLRELQNQVVISLDRVEEEIKEIERTFSQR